MLLGANELFLSVFDYFFALQKKREKDIRNQENAIKSTKFFIISIFLYFSGGGLENSAHAILR